jgi:predicted NUDIX family NTP pyrophosphohydrolase
MMTSKKSAGILLFRRIAGKFEVFLVHPGGPFWKNKDLGAWSIPKGEFNEDEMALAAAKREFKEETGIAVNGSFLELTPIRQKSGKWVHAWALEKNIDAASIKSNEFEVEWPPRSGKTRRFPEVDRAEWFTVEQAIQKIIPAQATLVDELVSLLRDQSSQ